MSLDDEYLMFSGLFISLDVEYVVNSVYLVHVFVRTM